MFIFGETMINSENNNSIMTIARENYRHPHGIDFGYPTDRFCNGISAAGCADHNHVQPIFQKPTDLTQYIAKSLFLISIGSNDYINNYLQPSTYASSQIYSGEGFAVLIINNFSEQLSKLYILGVRKTVCARLGPLGCIPSKYLWQAATTAVIEQTQHQCCKFFSLSIIQISFKIGPPIPIILDETFLERHNMFLVTNKACCGNMRNGGHLTCLPLQQPWANRNQNIFWDPFIQNCQCNCS
ncbi:GDSL esterase/lipase 7 [Citrus sinensis]|nr:GDSL esterase/lipase 7 [Citrus sinensis]